MIADFEDFCTWVFVIVDDIWQQIAPLYKRPGPAPLCSDSELITMALIGEARGLDSERGMLAFWKEHRDLFPHIPSQSRFNRRRRNLWQAFNQIRRMLLQLLDLAHEPFCIIDSLPVFACSAFGRAGEGFDKPLSTLEAQTWGVDHSAPL